MPEDAEALREACAIGDVDSVASILRRGAVDVNGRHALNGWTALHWASKRGHGTIVDLLLKHNADPSVVNFKEELPAAVSASKDIARRLGAPTPVEKDEAANAANDEKTFVPNYIKHPPFPYAGKEKSPTFGTENNNNNNVSSITNHSSNYANNNVNVHEQTVRDAPHVDNHHHSSNRPKNYEQQQQQQHLSHLQYNQQQHLPPHLHHHTCQAYAPYPGFHPRIFVLKVRVADQIDSDFIEVEFPRLECDVDVVDDVDVGSGGGGGDVVITSAPDDEASPGTTRVKGDGATNSTGTTSSSTELLTFESFVGILCDELRIPTPNLILKIRKLPDTIVRKVRDVHRLRDFQEIEVVLSKKPFSESPGSFRPFDAHANGQPAGYHTSPRRRSSSTTTSPPAVPATATILY